MNARRFWALAINTIQKEARGRGLWFFMAMTVAAILITNSAFDMVVEYAQEAVPMMEVASKKMVVFVFISNLWTCFMGLYFGLNSLKSDEEAGVTPFLMSFPVSRELYVCARLTGSAILVCAQHLLGLTLAVVLFSVSSGKFAMDGKLALAMLAGLLPMLGGVSVGALMSFFLARGPALALFLFVIPLIWATNSSLGSAPFAEHWQNLGVMKVLGILVHYLLPRLGTWSTISASLALDRPLPGHMWAEVVHLLAALTMGVAALCALFRRRGL